MISASYFEMAHAASSRACDAFARDSREMRAGKVSWFVAVYSVDFSVRPTVGPLLA